MPARRSYILWVVFFSLSFTLPSFSFSDLPTVAAAGTPNFDNCLFRNQWEYSDLAVNQNKAAKRGYTWGSESYGVYDEPYYEAPGGQRLVQYFDKSRMELSWDGKSVTNGLLTKELVSGLMQEGENSFRAFAAANIPVAGDLADSNLAPTYASFTKLISLSSDDNRQTARVGQVANQAVDRTGQVTILKQLPAQVKLQAYSAELGHNLPDVFVKFQNQEGLVWNTEKWEIGKVFTDDPTSNVFGLPISEPYWTQATVGGQTRNVLVQLFERRVLTYTPTNAPEYQVEMGNIGQHYHLWRYGTTTGPQSAGCAIDLSVLAQSNLPAAARPPVDCAVAKCIALTYDDGPSAYTPLILDALKQRNAVATFFVLGDKSDYFKPTLNRTLKEGNELGNHTWSHQHLPKLSAAQVRSEVQRTQAKIQQLTGYTPVIMRPPYGETNSTVAKNVGLPQILWTIDTFDWRDSNTYLTTQRVLSQAKPGRIVLMHDTHRSTALAAPAIIDGLIAQGYTLVTVSELLGMQNTPIPAGKVITSR